MGIMYPRLHGILSKTPIFDCGSVNWTTDRFALYEFENSGNLGEDTQGSLDLTNINGITQDAGIVGFSAKADHTSLQYFETPFLSTSLDLNLSWTFSLWGKVTGVSAPGIESILTIIDGSTSTVVIGNVLTGEMNAWIGANGFTGPLMGETIDISQWHHYALTKDGTVGKFYIDGVQASYFRDEPVPVLSQSGATVMRNFRGNTIYASGNIDQFVIWDKVLTGNEINCLYNSGAGVII